MNVEFMKLIEKALLVASENNTDIFTFALYHDHESGFVSVCIDTEKNSIHEVREQNLYNLKYFGLAIQNGEMDEAKLWQANIGRNLSLGNFSLINIAEIELPNEYCVSDMMYISMVDAINKSVEEIQKMCSQPTKLLCCCSTSDSEVGLTWAPYEPN